MLTTNTNVSVLTAIRLTDRSQSSLAVSMERLSSGLRINGAKDDAAGLAIANRMTSQVRGMSQAMRNINDGISLMQTAEGAMAEVTSQLQRGRELAIRAANASLSMSDRRSLQGEINQLVQEMNRISRDTSFNGLKIFAGADTEAAYVDTEGLQVPLASEKEQLLANLKRSWLEQSEKLITEYYGLTADQVALDIVFDDAEELEGAAAYVAAQWSGDGSLLEMSLHINMEAALAVDGTEWPNSSMDQLIAHEMVHAVMNATMPNMGPTGGDPFPMWFIEGAADFIPGADSRVAAELNGGTTATALVDNIENMDENGEWSVTNLNYATAYTSVAYLHELHRAQKGEDGLKEMTTWLAANPDQGLDGYFAQAGLTQSDGTTAIANEAEFVAAFEAEGEDFVNGDNNFDGTGSYGGLELTDDDTGAIGGPNASSPGGDTGDRDTTWDGTIPDIDNPTEDPLAGFVESWPEIYTGGKRLLLKTTTMQSFHVGAESGETISVRLASMSATSLGVSDVDLVSGAQDAIQRFDLALQAVDSARADLGANQNRMEYAASSLAVGVENLSASRSRIQDADYASEVARLTRANILSQAGISTISQASANSQLILSLLS